MSKFTKQVIVIRKDLNMRRGKEIAQGSHASMAFLTRQIQKSEDGFFRKVFGFLFSKWRKRKVVLHEEAIEWINNSFTKVTLVVNSEKELMDIYNHAFDEGLEVHLIVDSGRTEFNGVPTKTCLAIGPNYSEDIDKVTKHLKLY